MTVRSLSCRPQSFSLHTHDNQGVVFSRSLYAIPDRLAQWRKSQISPRSSSSSLANDAGRSFAAPQSPEELLKCTPSTLHSEPVYAYIVTTIETTPDYQLKQTGCGPNFNGGRITLCTCKHQGRATLQLSRDPNDPWKNVWVAGLTSKTANPSRSLAYLMCVERSFLNQRELWRYLPNDCRQAKSASKSTLGDLYEPKAAAKNAPDNPMCYNSPIRGHAHSTEKEPNIWHDDIGGWGRYSLPHRLLLGQVAQSYRWTQVKMILKPDVIGASAHHRIYPSLIEFIENLQEFDP